MQHSNTNTLRYTLGSLLTFAALNAFGGGYYGMSGAEGVPRELLHGSPFSDYFIPSVILFCIVGGSFLVASIVTFAKSTKASVITSLSVIIVSVWLIVQLWIIGYVSWMQPATALVAGIIIVLNVVLAKQSP